MKQARSKATRPLAVATALALWALLIPFAPQAVANHDSRKLEVIPDFQFAGAGTMATLTARLCIFSNMTQMCDPSPDVETIEIDFEIESGPGDISGPGNAADNTPNSPDLSCTVPANSATCTVMYSSTVTGTDTLRAWIDHDKSNTTVEADSTEGPFSGPTDCQTGEDPGNCPSPDANPGASPGPPNCTLTTPVPGAQTEPDCTDVVQIIWEPGPAAVMDCNPETADNPSTGSGSSETYTCTLKDSIGNPVSGIRVDGENFAGANDPDNVNGGTADYALCNSTGSSCSGDVSASDGEAGSATICFWLDNDNDNLYTPTGTDEMDGGNCDTELQGQDAQTKDLTDVVTKMWEARSSAGGGVDAEPDSDTNDINTSHVITATVYDQFGAEFVSQTTVNFEFFAGSPNDPANDNGNTPNTPDKTCTTNNSSSCTVSYTSTKIGTDLLCVWSNSAPAMQGANADGTCNGGNGAEGLNDPDDAVGTADAPEPASDDVDVVQKVWNDPNAASRLNCAPETDTNPAGSAHTISCTATNAAGTGIANANIDAEATGTNDPDNASSPTTPDFTCTTVANEPLTPTTDEAGTCSFTHGPAGTSASGLTTYRIWIDVDKDNATTSEMDVAEGRDEVATPGAPEPDGTDVVEKSWVPAPASLTMTPETDTARVGTCNAYTITALNAQNQPAQGAIIDVEQRHSLATNPTANDEPTVSFCTPAAADGPNPSMVDDTKGDLRPPDESPDNSGTAGGETAVGTDAAGKVTIGIKVDPGQGSDGSGTVNLSAFFETTENDDPDPSEPQDTSTKSWFPADGRTIDCEPETGSSTTGTNHVVTCTVKDRAGQPLAGEGVTFTETGPGTVSPASATTDAQGQAKTTATSTEAGSQSITGTLTDDTGAGEPAGVDECDRAANDPSGAPAGVCSDDVTKTWTVATTQCNDGVDNDGDGKTDHPADPGCENPNDNSESPDPPPPPPPTQCNNGTDDDGDGQTDFPSDPGCIDASDDSENSEGAETFTASSEIHIKFSKGAFHGRVTSTDQRCVATRQVVVKKIRDGRDRKIGEDTTDADGKYRVPAGKKRGRYYSIVKRRQIALATGDTLVCSRDRSETHRIRV